MHQLIQVGPFACRTVAAILRVEDMPSRALAGAREDFLKLRAPTNGGRLRRSPEAGVPGTAANKTAIPADNEAPRG